ncbi:helix-turn-helix transcriptional regulator [Archaeoglobus sp. UBA230]|jgi:uncharacterized membrane protein|uniref:helix-turn-helix transcriptional regulator n=1 Tax=unclassified Archaeoglobus TaxID=2643606 RepID=UPI0025B7C7EB|nr:MULTISPECIES: winged helix DNA-binding protein [unclassified Archaeoglobus]
MKKLLLVALLSVLILPSGAVEIYGKIYRWDTLDVVNNVVVEIKDDNVQRMVSEDGTYSFNVPPGNYTIVAYAGEYMTVENVSVFNSTRFDLILFPKLEEFQEIPDFPVVEEGEIPYHLIAVLISGVILAVLLVLKLRSKADREFELAGQPYEDNDIRLETLPEDLAEVVEIIRREGGRVTQKELRKKLGYSEAKMSLIIADLERRGIVEKVKKGRGNIIFLKQIESGR